jgi:hypothetical protein
MTCRACRTSLAHALVGRACCPASGFLLRHLRWPPVFGFFPAEAVSNFASPAFRLRRPCCQQLAGQGGCAIGSHSGLLPHTPLQKGVRPRLRRRGCCRLSSHQHPVVARASIMSLVADEEGHQLAVLSASPCGASGAGAAACARWWGAARQLRAAGTCILWTQTLIFSTHVARSPRSFAARAPSLGISRLGGGAAETFAAEARNPSGAGQMRRF